MKKYSDDELFKMVKGNDERAFTVLFDRYKQVLFRVIFQRTQSYIDSDEILQRIFISLWENRKSIVVAESLAPYLMGAAKKGVLDFFVRSTKKRQRDSMLTEELEPLSYPEEEVILARELASLVDSEVAKMPVTMRQSFELSRKENLSIREIAQKMSLSEQTS